MALITLRQMLDHAAERGYGVPAFNVNGLEQVHAIMDAAQEVDAPVILQSSPGAMRHAGEAYLRHLVLAAVERHPELPVVLHQHHGASPEQCLQSIRSGFTSVMMDGSLCEDRKTPAAFCSNVEVTRQVCRMAHACGVSVEGELGGAAASDRGDSDDKEAVGTDAATGRPPVLTSPAQAREFVAQTGVDALAIAVGTRHGGKRFTRRPLGEMLAIERIAQIRAHVPNTPLVIHSCSSLPTEWLTIIRKYGGEVADVYGVPVEEIQRAIANGVRKINIDTDIQLAMTGAMRRCFAEHPREFDPRRVMAEARAAARGIAKYRFEAFGCAGQASGLRPVALEVMAERYGRSGSDRSPPGVGAPQGSNH